MTQGMPTLTKGHELLSRFVGTWEGEETLSPSPWGPGGPARGKNVIRSVCDGFFVAQDYVEEKDGKVTFRGHGIFGFDAQTGEHIWYWVDSMGFPPDAPARGKWEDDLLVLEKTSPRAQARYTYCFEGPDRYWLTIDNCFDGTSWVRFMEGTYDRVG